MMQKKKIRVAVLMGGPSNEHAVSLASGKMVSEALRSKRYKAIPVVISKSLRWTFPKQGKRKHTYAKTSNALGELKARADIAFIALHGFFGEDGIIQALCESIGMPYTGSGVLASALAMDKKRSRELYIHHGLKAPNEIYITKNKWKHNTKKFLKEIKKDIKTPYVLKPVTGGSSVGVIVGDTNTSLEKDIKKTFTDVKEIVVQEYIKGVEVTCGVIEEKNEVKAFPVTEICPPEGAFFDYDAKYIEGKTKEITPACISKEHTSKIQEEAIKAHQIIGCKGFSRSDFIIRGENIYILETNTIPGLTKTSLLPQGAKAAGISFENLIDQMIKNAL